MKIRNGYVSNSSSSSFIVISDNGKLCFPKKQDVYYLGEDGEYEFGWQIEDYFDMDSKINFAYIQASTDQGWLKMLEDVLYEYVGYSITPTITKKWDHPKLKHACIDHQSSASEGENTEMFESKEKLIAFLFNPDSYIHNDNDNH